MKNIGFDTLGLVDWPREKTIFEGSEIPSDTVVGAGTTVMKKLKENYVVFGGNPVHIIRSDINWKK